jgi:Spy/CpxP family protein refolding chaperone
MKMNKLLFTIALSFVFTAAVLPQDFGQEEGSHKRRAPMKKIEELEKIKLLDVLNLDEAASAKLFTRRNQDRTKIWDLEDKINNTLQNIESEIKKGKDKDVSKIQKLNEDYCNLSMDVEKEKLSFLRSLSDILTPEQIGKYIVFERKFREEIRNLLMKERSKHNKEK